MSGCGREDEGVAENRDGGEGLDRAMKRLHSPGRGDRERIHNGERIPPF
jgi:hypothetical protein